MLQKTKVFTNALEFYQICIFPGVTTENIAFCLFKTSNFCQFFSFCETTNISIMDNIIDKQTVPLNLETTDTSISTETTSNSKNNVPINSTNSNNFKTDACDDDAATSANNSVDTTHTGDDPHLALNEKTRFVPDCGCYSCNCQRFVVEGGSYVINF